MTGYPSGGHVTALSSSSPAPPTVAPPPPRPLRGRERRQQRVRWSWGGCDTIIEDREATPRDRPPAVALRGGPKPARRHRVCRSWEGYRALEEEEATTRPDVMKGRWIDSMPGLKALVQRRSSAAPGPSPVPGPSATPTRPLLAGDRQLSTPSVLTLLRLERHQELRNSRLSLQSETSYSLPEMSVGQQATEPLLRGEVPRRPDPPVTSAPGGSGTPAPVGASCGSLTAHVQLHDPGVFRSASSRALLSEPLRPVNRLRTSCGSLSRVCSRCSSLLSLASSSRYSLDAAGSFEPVPPVLCKLCLGEVPVKDTSSIAHCGCTFCRDCMKCYVQFEIQEGAYDISCPDAQCARQGVVSLTEVQMLVGDSFMEKYKRYRLNREVDMDVSRLWCPKAGCETIVHICPTGERCLPQNVHCPTCASDFCSNCKHPWHGGITCEENTRLTQQLTKEPGIPFDNDLIKCCPMCNVPIEKDEGCAQMMCKRCKHVFCWYCLASLDDDFLLRHYDKGPCKNKLGHSRASVIWHRTQVIGIFAGFGILLLVASPLLLLAAPCIVCCKCRVCSGGGGKLDSEEESA